MTTTPLFSLNKLNLVYRALPALHDVSWSFLPSQQWACLGPNGAGKTSLARVLSRQATHYSGEFARSTTLDEQGVAYVCFEEAKTLCDRDKKLDDSEFRADASDPGTTVRSIILGSRSGDDEFDRWISRMNIGHILDRGLRYISTGEMRKTLLIKAILDKPALLILDSPLDGLDRQSQDEMRHVIDELLQSSISVLLLCRQWEDIPAGVSDVLVLNAGEVFQIGPRHVIAEDSQVHDLMNPPALILGELPPPVLREYELTKGTPLLELHDVGVRYGELDILRKVEWIFRPGQHCCVSGPNGCGKTTLLSLVTGDNHKAYGQNITLFGQRRGSGESVWDIKQKYGQLDTQLHLNYVKGMRVLEVVLSGFFDTIGLYDEWGDAQRQTALEWLSALGMTELAREKFDALSFGLQRMVLLARAMVKSPIILLLDEPTLGLDGHHRKLIRSAVDHIAKNSDTQIIYVSHSVGDVPDCISQFLTFEPTADGYQVVCNERV